MLCSHVELFARTMLSLLCPQTIPTCRVYAFSFSLSVCAYLRVPVFLGTFFHHLILTGTLCIILRTKEFDKAPNHD